MGGPHRWISSLMYLTFRHALKYNNILHKVRENDCSEITHHFFFFFKIWMLLEFMVEREEEKGKKDARKKLCPFLSASQLTSCKSEKVPFERENSRGFLLEKANLDFTS